MLKGLSSLEDHRRMRGRLRNSICDPQHALPYMARVFHSRSCLGAKSPYRYHAANIRYTHNAASEAHCAADAKDTG